MDKHKIDIHKRRIGVNFTEENARILLWAPNVDQVSLKISQLDSTLPLIKEAFGYWSLDTSELRADQRYGFELISNNGTSVIKPDPATVFQPDGIYEFSQAYDISSFPWTDENWKGNPLASYIIYELHTGTFSSEGTFNGIEQKLDYLIDLGITAIEIMPVSQFPGNRNWGYDGVFPFAVQASYGGPLALQNFVNICHKKGLSVILDVVYNHFGPEGNNFSDFGPYFTDTHHTPWGDAINFDNDYAYGVRHYFIENVLMWFRDFHIDALRLDAVHALKDLSNQHILSEIKSYVDQLSKLKGRNFYLIIECDLNDTKYINPQQKQGYGMDTQWLDEFHHSLRVAAGQQREGYYAEFNGVAHLAKSYKDAYVYDGVFSEGRNKIFGTKATNNLGEQFVIFSQNHDQVGNRMLGERSGNLYSFKMQKLLAGAIMVAPYLPLLFMGEEYGETNPFLYFVSHGNKDLIKAVRNGRKAEFEAFHSAGDAPDPQDEQTFHKSKLKWNLLESENHKQIFFYYQTLIRLRKANAVLNKLNRNNIETYSFSEQNCLIIKRWQQGEELLCLFNFSNRNQQIELPFINNSVYKIFDSEDEKFGGEQLAQPSFSKKDKIELHPETFLIYSNIYD